MGWQQLTDKADLIAIADELSGLKRRFVQSSQEMYLKTEDQAKFKAFVAEAQAIIGGALGHLNNFSTGIIRSLVEGQGGFFGGPSFACVEEVDSLVRAAVRQIERRERAPLSPPISVPLAEPYVSLSRIAALESLPSHNWDYSKLIQLCKELNTVTAAGDCHYSTAMLVRAITDHVPPVFGLGSFAQVAANSNGASLKGSMKHLDQSLRHIADAILHEQIRKKEALPSPQQVNFKADLDRLLGEIVRISS
jgi:hypothetical protein